MLWIYFWAFYPLSLIYVSVFVSVPYCFDYGSFVVWSKVREPDSSSSIFLSHHCFDYSEFFVGNVMSLFFNMLIRIPWWLRW